MIRLPLGFWTTPYPGYYFHLKEQKLYSLKSGILKPLKMHRFRNPHLGYREFVGWQVSHLGKRRYLEKNILIRNCKSGLHSQVGVIECQKI